MEHADAAGTEVVTAALADELAGRFVGHLREAGHRPGSRIVFLAPNSALLLASVAGALRAGYAAIVLSPRLTERERGEMVGDVGPCVVLNAAGLALAQTAGPVPLDAWWRSRPMHFTSGTSGRPKGVWSGWLDRSAGEALVGEEQAAWGITAADRHLVCGPMSHSAPLRFPLVTLAAGGSVLIPPAFEPATVRGLIETGTATTTFMAPTHLMRLLDDAPPDRSSMRMVAHAGSPCPAHVRARARAAFGDAAVREFYGSTEGQFTVCTPAEFDARPGTVGRARPGRQLRVADDGRIWCRVPQHARFEYWGDPDKTRRAWRGAWFTVGDLGRMDPDGYLYLDGRRSDLIITGGVNVYPAEIERVVLDLPAVRQAVAFGVDDDDWGQRVCVAVVGDVTVDDVRQLCRRQLAPAKRPKTIHVVDALPLTHSGKVDRVRVPARFGQQG